MSQVTLITSYYTDKNARRMNELFTCVTNNINNPLIDKILLVTDTDKEWEPFEDEKVLHINFGKRPTYREMFNLAGSFNPQGINILCNTDIFFLPEDIHKIKSLDLSRKCLALTRWDIQESGDPIFFNRNDSQDSWVWKGKIPANVYADFHFGKLGCDNRIAHELQEGGVTPINPSRQIKSYHLHLSGIRNYKRSNKKDVIPEPYLRVNPKTINIPSGPYIPKVKVASPVGKKRIFHIALNYQGIPQMGLVRSLQSMGEYKQFDWIRQEQEYGRSLMRQRLLEVHRKFDPHLTFMQVQQGDIIDPATAKQLGGFVINWTGDVRHPIPRWFYDMGKSVNLTCFTNMHDVEELRKSGIDADYLQIGFDQQIFRPTGKTLSVADIVFMANHHKNHPFPLSAFRYRIAQHLMKEYGERFKVYGVGWDFQTTNLNFQLDTEANVYRSCKIAINCSHFEYSRYSSDRIFRLMGSGAFCLCKWYPDIELDFEDGKHLRVWHTLEELSELIDYYLKHEEERKRIQKAGTLHVHENHTWEARVKDMWTLHEQYSKSKVQ